MAYKLILADDHALFRSGLKMILEKNRGIEIAGEASCGKEAVRLVREASGGVDLVVLDINMPDMDGIEVAEAIRAFDADVGILMVTMYEDEAYLKAALKAGADGYVTKQAIDEELITAVNAILDGRKYIYPTLAALLFEDSSESEEGAGANPGVLSAREKEVLRYLALGYTQREIGESLFISEKTVETYKSRLLTKLGLEKRSELVRYAFENGIVEL
ncbi:response regulator transcription factor [Gordonibacter massiliensis (ex Traore et al. 2017)]|uniref:Response regulator transcription factor n=1 Tax=Gordonibacter massiliensis (ex Traore et al. 2017) TaxID=1841863 RepID=A0A842J8M9_9ACTN|nr:response regulator transcription factor [Gordonibacter massiliensis (ex Traore et al. 2017)]MBC2888153.1 response regulator transcription factor [Gordonibacter massiliensis (ex Traore et al. 2017)]MBX9032785.1 response regulator transcription factor [Gordonibacter massiliensis (ex Traore et al. 2017)]